CPYPDTSQAHQHVHLTLHDALPICNLFRTSHHVSRRPWVAEAAVGISSQWLVAGHGIRLALMRVWRTREFDEQVGHHAFGSVALDRKSTSLNSSNVKSSYDVVSLIK